MKKLAVVCAVLAASTLQAEIEPIFRLTPDYSYSWKKKDPRFDSRLDYLKVTADPAKSVKWTRQLSCRTDNYFPYYVASEKAVLTCTYRSDVKVRFAGRITTMLRPLSECYFGADMSVAKDWTAFRCEIAVPRQELDHAFLGFDVAAGTGAFEVKDLRIDEAEPARKGGMPLMLDGKHCTEICVIKSDDPMRRRHEMKAALMLRYSLYQAGGEYLPVKTVASADEAAAVAVIIGGALGDRPLPRQTCTSVGGALGDRPLPCQTCTSVGGALGDRPLPCQTCTSVGADPRAARNRFGKGGYEMSLKDGRLTLKGAIPCGPQFGAFRLMEKLGIRYLGGDFWTKPTAFDLAAFDAVETPDIAERTIQSSRSGFMCELKGFLGDLETTINCGPASYTDRGELRLHTMGYIIPLPEFEKTHPEYFALLKDGSRLTSKNATVATVKYCYTNPGLLDEYVKRYGEILDSQPATFMVDTLAGDGGENLCQCAECKKYPTVADLTYTFFNRVAKRLAEKHPRVDINYWSYVDNPKPPVGKVEPRCENLKLRYAIYPMEYWDSALIWDDEANAEGHKALAAWRKLIPDAASALYYASCNEGFLAFQPHFDFQVEAIRDFAAHKANASEYLGLHGVHGNGVLNGGGMMDLVQYIVARVSMHADYDVEAGLKEYFRDVYGAAEKPMRAFFDRTRGEYRRRHWVTNSEVSKRGFFTEAFATVCLGHLDAALAAVKGDRKLTEYILRDKQMFLYSYFKDVCRGRGNVPRSLFPTWAKRLSEFCRITRTLGFGYMEDDPVRYFHDYMLYDVSKTTQGRYNWWKAPEIDKLIADPEKALGADFPNRAKKTEKGWLIPAAGMVGGQFMENSRWMRKTPADLRCIRRESSGFGLLQTAFDLTAVPAAGVKLVVTGIRSEKKDDWPMLVVEVNGRTVFDGRAKWAGDVYGPLAFDVPADALVAGRNDLVLKNPTPDPEAKLDGAGGANFRVKRDYNSSWFIVESIAVDLK